MAFNRRTDISKPKDIFSTITAMLVVTSDQAPSRSAAERNRDELESLCTTLGIRCAAWDFFNVRSFNSATYIGSGQVERLAWIAQENMCNLVVFNNSISPRIQRNLEEILGIAVVDRQEIILQIFAERAATREARLQSRARAATFPSSAAESREPREAERSSWSWTGAVRRSASSGSSARSRRSGAAAMSRDTTGPAETSPMSRL